MADSSTTKICELSADRRVLELLAQTYPNISAAATEIINLEAILNLPKGTEHFVADVHGEYEAFRHILKNASGNIKRKVTDLFGSTMRDAEIKDLCTLIYYPRPKLERIKASETNIADFYKITLNQLVKVVRSVSSKYTRSKVRKALPKSYAYIIEELLHETPDDTKKQAYFNRIIETIIITGQADDFITAMAHVIQRLAVDRLHILGDIYDRGPGAHLIMDMLTRRRDFDIQWGNHDMLWMGAAAGNNASIANVLRISLRYGNMLTLQEGYGINLVPLVTFAMENYADDPCEQFMPHVAENTPYSEKTQLMLAKMHKAIAVIQFKLEAEIIRRHPKWAMDDRLLLDKIDYAKGTITLPEGVFELTDKHFPTINPADPYALTADERILVDRLHHSFTTSEKLAAHAKTLLSRGSLYLISNGNLLFHASLPMNADGTLRSVKVGDEELSGRPLFDAVTRTVRVAMSDTRDSDAIDYLWYLWCGSDSPLFDKSRMTTFERYFIADKSTHREQKGHYYTLREDPAVCDAILDSFGVKGTHRHIINGHVPVRAASGENPVKADGRLMVIDGGFARAYHHTTGIAGYTLVFHSRGFELVQHQPFTSAEEAVEHGTDITSTNMVVEMSAHRMRVRDTDKGAVLQSQIDELMQLLAAYRNATLAQPSPE